MCEPSPVASYRARLPRGHTTFAWVLVPTRHGQASGATAKVRSENDTHVVVEVVVGGNVTTVSVELE